MRRSISSLAFLILAAIAPTPNAWAADPPKSLARYFPRKNLVAFVEFDGLDAHAEVVKKTAAFKLLKETPAGELFAALIRHVGTSRFRGGPLTPGELETVFKHAAGSGFAVGVIRAAEAEPPGTIALVIRGGGKGPARGPIEKYIKSAADAESKSQTVDRPGGRSITFDLNGGEPGIAWFLEGDDIAVTNGATAGADLMVEALEGRTPSAAAHPDLLALAKPDGGVTPLGVALLDVKALGPNVSALAAFGLESASRLDYRVGVEGDAVVTFIQVVAPAPRTGLLALLDPPVFHRGEFPPLPANVPAVTSFSVNLPELFDRIATGVESSSPVSKNAFETAQVKFRDVTGLRVRDDILTMLGPRVTIYTPTSRVDAPANPLAGLALGFGRAPSYVVRIEVKDPKPFAKMLDEAMNRLDASFKTMAETASQPRLLRVRIAKGPNPTYTLAFAASALPLPFPSGFLPTFVLGKDALIIGTTPEIARDALAAEGKADPKAGPLPAGDPLAPYLGKLPENLTFAHVGDPGRSYFPELIANLPAVITWGESTASNGIFIPPITIGNSPQQQQLAAMRRNFQMQMQSMTQMFRQQGGNAGLGTGTFTIDPDGVPNVDQLRPYLFPSLYALSADDQAIRFTSREAFPILNPAAVAPVSLVLLLPALQSAKAEVRRAQSVNNLKQMGLAFHNYHSSMNVFPPEAINDPQGKPLLSWRVAILPYLEQGALYNQFRLNEPWDSPNNKALIAKMPAVYAIPGAKAKAGETFYRGFGGESALFDPKLKGGTGMQTITDGTSNTLGLVEAKTAVVWTKPDTEIPYAMNLAPAETRVLIQSVGGHFAGGFNALMLDGSVRFIKTTVNTNVFKALISRSGGEVVSGDSY